MPKYSFEIRKSDHPQPDGNFDLHVHVFYNEGKRRKLLGRYRVPSLEPVFPSVPELNRTETNALREWLGQPEQIRKLENMLNDTVFDLHRVGRLIWNPEIISNMDIQRDKSETYLVIKIPVAKRLE